MRHALLILAAVLTASLSACAQPTAPTLASPAPQTSPDAVVAGKALAQSNCAACHAIGRTGASPVAGAPPLRTLSARYPVESLEEAFGEGIVVGHPMMPEFKFTPGQISQLIAYLTSIQDAPAPTSAKGG